MTKKVTQKIVAALAIVTAICMMAGCGKPASESSQLNVTDKDSQKTQSEASGSETVPDGSSDDVYQLVMEYVYPGTLKPDIQMVQDAINDISREKIGVEVTIYPVTLPESMTQMSLMITSGEQVDLVIGSRFSGFLQYVSNNLVIPLDDLYEQYGAEIADDVGDAIAGGYIDGTLWGIPSIDVFSKQYGYMARTDLLEKYNLQEYMDETKQLTYEDLDKIFELVKAGEGADFYPLIMVGASQTTFDNYKIVDYLGSSAASGGIMDNGRAGKTIENVYKTEAYAEHCKWMRKWYEAGYINPDVLTSSETADSYMINGRGMMISNYTYLDMEEQSERNYKMDITALRVSQRYVNTNMYQDANWCIPVTCADPAKTMQFLSLLHSDVDIINLIYNGIENIHYVKTDVDRIIDYPKGLDASSVGYGMQAKFYGSPTKRDMFVPLDENYFAELEDWNYNIPEECISPYLGYVFNPNSMKTEIAAINDVMNQYRPALETGSVDPDEVLPQFIQALEDAGIEDVIAANQAKLNEWLAQNKK